MHTSSKPPLQLPPFPQKISLPRVSDETLLEYSRKKDYLAFEELVKRYEGRIYRLGLKMLRSPEDAEDILQKTFLSVFENMDKFRGESKFSTWIFRIATNHALMKLRKEKGKTIDSLDNFSNNGDEPIEIQLPDPDIGSQVPSVYEQKELMENLEKIIREMPEIYRIVFILRDLEGFSNQEVAKMLDMSVPGVKSRILRARLLVREKLAKFLERKEENEK